MKKLIFTIIAAIACSVTSHAQLLWKISGNNLKEPSYIFGTYHVANMSITDSIKGFKQAFDSSRQLYGELDMSFMADMSSIQKMQQAAMLPQDSLLNTLYTPDEYELIDQACKKYIGIGADMLKMLKPVAISSQITVSASTKLMSGLSQNEQLDMALQKKAKEANKKVCGLETLDQQINILFNTPITEQAKELLKYVKDGNIEEDIRKLADAYMKQDIDQLDSIIQETENEGESMDELIYNRNKNWAEQMNGIMQEAPTFFVVGAGHLSGEKGVINLLEEKGYKVEPVW